MNFRNVRLLVLLIISSISISNAHAQMAGLSQLLNMGMQGYNSVLNTAKTAATTKVGTTSANTAASLQQAKMMGVDPNIIKLLLGGGEDASAAVSNPNDALMSSLLNPEYGQLVLQTKLRQDSMFLILDSLKVEKQKLKDIDLSNEIFGHRFFTTNNLEFFFKSTDTKAPDSYIVGPGDEILISVWGYADYNNKLKVNDDGYIQETEFGRLYVKGLTFGAVKALIGKRLNSFINTQNTKYEITLNYSRSIDVNIVGEVVTPGTFKIPAINTVYNAINAADGVTNIGTVRDIQIRRDGKVVKRF